ncbi:MAG TPA: triose-phosphate isomerase [Candidatus Acidoferrales bacterium]|nr:triose-phosphate isomerase [Candidatus Acidoferrales bacterium]
MRHPVIVGNWKMHKTQAETRSFFEAFKPLVSASRHCDIVVAPPFTAIAAAVDATAGTLISIAGQDGSWERAGAFTGEVSMPMLIEAGCRNVIIGHSERRKYFGETDATVNRKLKAAIEAGLQPIVCVGEDQSERDAGHTEQLIERQFIDGMATLTGPDFSRILIAYEPVWAIGTGRTATPEIAAEVHAFLRGLAAKRFTPELAARARILYGGSVNPDNIGNLMAEAEIDGALVGGASLDARSFSAIVNF